MRLSKDFYQEIYELEKRLPKGEFLKVYSWMVSHRNLWEETPISNEKIFSDLSEKELLLLEEMSSAISEENSEENFEED